MGGIQQGVLFIGKVIKGWIEKGKKGLEEKQRLWKNNGTEVSFLISRSLMPKRAKYEVDLQQVQAK